MDMPLRLVATLRPACLRESKQSLVRSRRRRCARARARLDRCPCRPDTGTDVVSSKRAPEWSEVKWSGEEVEKGGRVPGRRSREREWILLCSLSLCLFTTSPVESKGAASRRGSLSCLATAPRDRDPARQALGGAQLTKQRTTFPSQARRAIGRSWQRDDGATTSKRNSFSTDTQRNSTSTSDAASLASRGEQAQHLCRW